MEEERKEEEEVKKKEMCRITRGVRVVQLVAHLFHNLKVASLNPARVTSRFFFWQG